MYIVVECAYYTELDAISLRGWRVSALAEAPGLGGNTGDTLPPDGLSLDQLALEDTTTQPYEAQRIQLSQERERERGRERVYCFVLYL